MSKTGKIVLIVLIAVVLIVIGVIINKEVKRKKQDSKKETEAEEVKEEIKSKVLNTVNKSKEEPTIKIKRLSEKMPNIGDRVLVGSKIAIAYKEPQAKKSNMIRGIRENVFAGTFLADEKNGFVKLIDEKENIIFMLTKDLYFYYK